MAIPELLTVHARQPSRWRAGLHFTPEPRTLDPAKIGAKALAAIEADPMLVVAPVGATNADAIPPGTADTPTKRARKTKGAK